MRVWPQVYCLSHPNPREVVPKEFHAVLDLVYMLRCYMVVPFVVCAGAKVVGGLVAAPVVCGVAGVALTALAVAAPVYGAYRLARRIHNRQHSEPAPWPGHDDYDADDDDDDTIFGDDYSSDSDRISWDGRTLHPNHMSFEWNRRPPDDADDIDDSAPPPLPPRRPIIYYNYQSRRLQPDTPSRPLDDVSPVVDDTPEEPLPPRYPERRRHSSPELPSRRVGTVRELDTTSDFTAADERTRTLRPPDLRPSQDEDVYYLLSLPPPLPPRRVYYNRLPSQRRPLPDLPPSSPADDIEDADLPPPPLPPRQPICHTPTASFILGPTLASRIPLSNCAPEPTHFPFPIPS